MRNEEVRKLNPIDRMCYWIRERHQIYLKKEAGLPKPWTDDEVMQQYFFTCPYRENDKTTRWFRENVREPLRDSYDVLMATIIFRWFNWIDTGERLWTYGEGIDGCCNLLQKWNHNIALAILQRVRDHLGYKIFTGAFMINSPGGKPKLEAICERITKVWEDREQLLAKAMTWKTLEQAHKDLTKYEGLGGFMAYEVVCDLRYTRLLENATDKDTWCHIGPGATRGLYRVLDIPFEKGNNSTSPPPLKNGLEEMQKLLKIVRRRLAHMPKFEMREIEHSCCEWDKAERARFNDGRLKRTYNGN